MRRLVLLLCLPICASVVASSAATKRPVALLRSSAPLGVRGWVARGCEAYSS
jgi:hypothetical protein